MLRVVTVALRYRFYLGVGSSELTSKIDDALVEKCTSVVSRYVSYFIRVFIAGALKLFLVGLHCYLFRFRLHFNTCANTSNSIIPNPGKVPQLHFMVVKKLNVVERTEMLFR